MNWLYVLPYIIITIIYIVCISRSIIKYKNSAPHGTTFTKKFLAKLVNIDRALYWAEVPSFSTWVNGQNFNVTVRKDETPKGLEYESISAYKSYCAYIDNEAVCRVHILHVNCKDTIYLEFSSKRKYDEIIEIINNVYTQAENILTEHDKKWFNTDRRSFYNTNNVKTED